MLTDHSEKLLASLGNSANLEGQIETSLTDETETKSSCANNPTDLKVRSSRADDPTVDDPEIGKPGADTPGIDNQRILKRD